MSLTLGVSSATPPYSPYQTTAYLLVYPVGPIAILDPVNQLLSGNAILRGPETLATLGIPVTGIAADGVARVVLRIPALSAGEQLTLTLLDDNGSPNPPAGYGSLSEVGGQVQPSPLQLTAVDTLEGPMAFAIYIAPPNFNYQGRYSDATTRTASFAVQAVDHPDFNSTTGIKIWRPPVMLVHGMWGDTSDWDHFTPLVNDTRFFVRRASYNFPITGLITDSEPLYLTGYANASSNAVGLFYNAQLLLPQFQTIISEFRATNQAAAAQADVVGHSMGGLVVRQAEEVDGFMDGYSFGKGYVHKLITIGTPHFGSPLALDLLNGQVGNQCIDNWLALAGSFVFETVQLSSPGLNTWPGAIGDLQGNGMGGNMSQTLQDLQLDDGHPVPTAMIAGQTSAANLAGLSCTFCNSSLVSALCGPTGVAGALTPQGWPALFAPDTASDAIVNVTSEGAGLTSTNVTGVIHTAALEPLNFTGPAELDAAGGIAALVIGLLNKSATQANGFYPLP